MPLSGTESESVRQALKFIEAELDKMTAADPEWGTGRERNRIEEMERLSWELRDLLRMPRRRH